MEASWAVVIGTICILVTTSFYAISVVETKQRILARAFFERDSRIQELELELKLLNQWLIENTQVPETEKSKLARIHKEIAYERVIEEADRKQSLETEK